MQVPPPNESELDLLFQVDLVVELASPDEHTTLEEKSAPSNARPAMTADTAISSSPPWYLIRNEWESSFFERPIAKLVVDADRDVDAVAAESAIRTLVEVAYSNGIQLLECHLPVTRFLEAAALEANDFRLVDSKARFLTEWSIDDISATEPRVGRIRDFVPSDRNRIIELTHENFTHNDQLISRFKNPAYFTMRESEGWFEAWLTNTAFEGNALTAVFEVEGRVVGYYIYSIEGTFKGLPRVQGILTAVEKAWRGANGQLAMQAHLYRKIPYDRWVLDNATQIANLPVVRNHIRSQKRLEEVILVFYRNLELLA